MTWSVLLGLGLMLSGLAWFGWQMRRWASGRRVASDGRGVAPGRFDRLWVFLALLGYFITAEALGSGWAWLLLGCGLVAAVEGLRRWHNCGLADLPG